jgi:hypothetical protein
MKPSRLIIVCQSTLLTATLLPSVGTALVAAGRGATASVTAMDAMAGHAIVAPGDSRPASVPPIGWWERAADWSEETSDGLLGLIGS